MPKSLHDPATLAVIGVFLALHLVAAFSFHEVQPGWPNGRLNWDGGHFEEIARNGYPPLGVGQQAGLATYGFYPLYPSVIGALSSFTGLSIGVVAVAISLATATVAVGIAARWLSIATGSGGAAAVLIGLVVSPAFPVLQMAYAEGPALLLLVMALRSLSAGSYRGYAVAVLLLGLTRAVVAPLAIVAITHACVEYRRGSGDRAMRGPVLAVIVSCMATFLWPAVAAVLTRDPLVYFDAMDQFRKPGAPASLLLAGVAYPFFGALLVAFVGFTTWVGARLIPREVPLVLRAWVVAYPPYVVAVSVISTSPLRYLILAFPFAFVLLPMLARPRWRAAALVVAIGVSIMASQWWIHAFVPVTIDGTIP